MTTTLDNSETRESKAGDRFMEELKSIFKVKIDQLHFRSKDNIYEFQILDRDVLIAAGSLDLQKGRIYRYVENFSINTKDRLANLLSSNIHVINDAMHADYPQIIYLGKSDMLMESMNLFNAGRVSVSDQQEYVDELIEDMNNKFI